MMLRISKLKTVGRVAALLFLLVALMGPWFADSHPATEQTCRPPLVWLGDGRCACLESFLGSVKNTFTGQASLGMLNLPPLLPFLSTLLLILLGERRWLWIGHLTAWGLTALYALFFFFVGNMYTWGDGLAAVVAVTTLVGEILIARRQVFKRSAAAARNTVRAGDKSPQNTAINSRRVGCGRPNQIVHPSNISSPSPTIAWTYYFSLATTSGG